MLQGKPRAAEEIPFVEEIPPCDRAKLAQHTLLQCLAEPLTFQCIQTPVRAYRPAARPARVLRLHFLLETLLWCDLCSFSVVPICSLSWCPQEITCSDVVHGPFCQTSVCTYIWLPVDTTFPHSTSTDTKWSALVTTYLVPERPSTVLAKHSPQ